MGAASAMLYTAQDPSIAGIVLDSPFASLPDIAEELALEYQKIPGWVTSVGLKIVASSIKKKA